MQVNITNDQTDNGHKGRFLHENNTPPDHVYDQTNFHIESQRITIRSERERYLIKDIVPFKHHSREQIIFESRGQKLCAIARQKINDARSDGKISDK